MELHPDTNGSVNNDSDSDGFTTADCRAIQMVLSTVIASISKSKLLIVLIFAGKRSHRLKEEKLKGGLKITKFDICDFFPSPQFKLGSRGAMTEFGGF
ncbi:hypothetical protein L1887_06169 [Cichorium endivia]|nr:hypothetical protein L1887_06169 [Cichorium endivia]